MKKAQAVCEHWKNKICVLRAKGRVILREQAVNIL